MLPAFSLPTPVSQPEDRSFPSWRNWWTTYSDRIFTYLSTWMTQQLLAQFNTLLTGYGPDIASATIINPTNLIHRVTGSVTIATINAPVNVVGPLMLYARDGFSITTGGNCTPAIAVAAGHGAWCAFLPTLGVAGTWVCVSS